MRAPDVPPITCRGKRRITTGWPGWWGLEGPGYLAWLAEQPEADYTVLMGAATYRLMSGFAAGGEPGTGALAGMSTVVFSATLSEPLSWANTQLVAQDPVEAVREMKDKAARSMRTIGSLTLCRSLLKSGLADRFRVITESDAEPEAVTRPDRCRLWAVHRVSVWCDRIAQNALFCVVTTVRRLELAGFGWSSPV